MASVGYNTVRYNELGKSKFVNPKLDVNAASQPVGYASGLIDALQT